MSKGAISFSTDDDYYTPPELVKKFGPFDYDPATTAERAKLFNIPNYDTKDTDGLKADWTNYKRIWINPPFTMKRLFWEKAWETYLKSKNEIYFLCPIAFLTTKRFHEKFIGGTVYLPNGRIKFENCNGITKSPAFGSVVIKLGLTQKQIEIIDLDYDKELEKIVNSV